MIDIIKLIFRVINIFKWLPVLWLILKFGYRIYKTFNDHDFISSASRTNILKQAMDAVNESDILKLTNSLQLFDSLPKRK